MLEETRTVLVRSQRRSDRSDEQFESLSRRIAFLWMAIVMLAIGIGLLAFYELMMGRAR